MIIHQIHIAIGQVQNAPDGRPIFKHQAVCGKEIFALAVMPGGMRMAVGPKPHAECARCFPVQRGRSGAFDMPTGEVPIAETFDETGRKATTERTSEMGRNVDLGRLHDLRVKDTKVEGIDSAPISDTDGLGRLEGGDFG